jgi:hypothetical protein
LYDAKREPHEGVGRPISPRVAAGKAGARLGLQPCVLGRMRRLYSVAEHGLDTVSMPQADREYRQRRVVGLDSPVVSGGYDLVRLCAKPPLISGASDNERSVQV